MPSVSLIAGTDGLHVVPGGAAPDPSVQVDLSGWTIASDTRSLIVSRSSSNIEIADVTANTNFSQWAKLTGPAITPGVYQITIERTNPTSLDRAGIAVGWSDANTELAFGPFWTSSNRESFMVNNGSVVTSIASNQSANMVGSRLTFVVDNALETPRQFLAQGVNAAGNMEYMKTAGTNDSEVSLSSPVLTAYIRHGSAGVGSNSNFNYRMKYTRWDLPTL